MLRAALISAALLLPTFAYASDDSATKISSVPVAAQNQDRCIAQMSDFPTDDPTARYQFLRLVSDVGFGADVETRQLFNHYGQPRVEIGTPVLSVIEDIANPVLRQAAPEIVVASMNHLVDFAQTCDVYITGQTESLTAFDPTLANPELNTAIAEDALFLRQILSESLSRLGADSDPIWAGATRAYSRSLITQRDSVEFAAFESEIAELETLFMDDLDGRLARSNDVINSEMDREILGDSVQLSNDMNEAAMKQARQDRLYRLLRIFGGGR
jgi:hypothetical protein